jgi:hypothetical protein
MSDEVPGFSFFCDNRGVTADGEDFPFPGHSVLLPSRTMALEDYGRSLLTTPNVAVTILG